MMKAMTVRIAILMVLLTVVNSVSVGQTYLFQEGLDVGGNVYGGTQDTMTNEAVALAYGNARENVYVRGGGTDPIRCTVLLRFTDLQNHLPNNFVVQSARIGLTLFTGVPQGDLTVKVSELLKKYDNTILTWATDGLGNQWSQAGALGVDANVAIPADRSEIVMDSVVILDGTSPYETYWWDIDPNMVQRWVRNDKSNYGVLFYCTEDDSSSATFVARVATGEWVDLKPYRPQLEITGFVAIQCSDFVQNNKSYSEDFNQDCYIDFKDLKSFVEYWLVCNDPQESSCLD